MERGGKGARARFQEAERVCEPFGPGILLFPLLQFLPGIYGRACGQPVLQISTSSARFALSLACRKYGVLTFVLSSAIEGFLKQAPCGKSLNRLSMRRNEPISVKRKADDVFRQSIHCKLCWPWPGLSTALVRWFLPVVRYFGV